MDEATKRAKIHDYFVRFRFLSILLILFGVVALPAAIWHTVTEIVRPDYEIMFAGGASIFCGAVYIAWYVNMARRRPSEQELDAWLRADLEAVSAAALRNLELDKTKQAREPVQLTAPRMWDTAGAPIKCKRGSDDILRFTPIDVSIIHFTDTQVLSFRCVLDFLSGQRLATATKEFFYKDIVSVSAETVSTTVNSPKFGVMHLSAAEAFTLVTTGGTSMSVILTDPGLVSRMGGGALPVKGADGAVQALRTLLREKKA